MRCWSSISIRNLSYIVMPMLQDSILLDMRSSPSSSNCGKPGLQHFVSTDFRHFVTQKTISRKSLFKNFWVSLMLFDFMRALIFIQYYTSVKLSIKHRCTLQIFHGLKRPLQVYKCFCEIRDRRSFATRLCACSCFKLLILRAKRRPNTRQSVLWGLM